VARPQRTRHSLSQPTAVKCRRSRWWIIAGALALAGLVGWKRGWFASEPVYRGRTVTQWLDRMSLFEEERNRDVTGENSLHYPSPQGVTNDPALKALLKIGSNAIPVLEQRLSDPPEWPRTVGLGNRFMTWAGWKWKRLRGSGPTPPRPAPMYHSSVQRARAMAAGLPLLALGTNADGRVGCRLEAYVRSLNGTNMMITTLYPTFSVARSGLPERRSEIVAGITSSLQHANALIGSVAATLTRLFWEDSPSWKRKLLEMTEDKDQDVRLAAMWALATAERGDPEILRLLESTFKNDANPERLRGYAAAGLGLAGIKATNCLPLLQKEVSHTNSFLRRGVHTAIQSIEKAIQQ